MSVRQLYIQHIYIFNKQNKKINKKRIFYSKNYINKKENTTHLLTDFTMLIVCIMLQLWLFYIKTVFCWP